MAEESKAWPHGCTCAERRNAEVRAMEAEAKLMRVKTEIGLGTYGRKPSEMLATSDAEKLRLIERFVRDEIR